MDPSRTPAELHAACRDFLAAARDPVSGRRVAEALGVSPTTANGVLKMLAADGRVLATPAGRAVLWSLAEDAANAAADESLPSDVPDQQAWRSAEPAPWDEALPVVVLTALALEYRAVRELMEDVSQQRSRTGTRFEVGTVRGRSATWRVHLAEIGMGNAGAAAEAAGAIAHVDPRLLVFFGIAGGLKPADQALGDVVVADRVYNLHSGKVADGGTASRPLSWTTSHRLQQLVRHVARDWQPSALPGTRGRVAQAHIRPIVAGEVVLADPENELRRLVAERFNDAAAVDMESFGVYEAAQHYDVPVLAVRGLSDLVGGKTADADRRWQPRAAASAGAFLRALLDEASREDLPNPRGGARPSTAAAPPEAQLDRLPPAVRPWEYRVRAHSPDVADTALDVLVAQSAQPAGWLGRLRHRPPPWLRTDPYGDAWAMVATYAASHASPIAGYAYTEAADRADAAGLDVVADVHRLAAALALARYPRREGEAGADADEVGRQAALERLDADTGPLRPVRAFLRAAVDGTDPAGALQAAAAAVAALGADPRLTGHEVAPVDEAATAALTELQDEAPDVHAGLLAEVLALVAALHLSRGEIDGALTALRAARRVRPEQVGLLLLQARARLQQLTEPAAAVANTVELLADVERTALLVRQRRRAWHTPSGEALALAGRARATAGNPRGALRLLLPAPRGEATDAEARDPAVAEVGAQCALSVGDARLALDLAPRIAEPVERDLVRGAAMSRLPGMADQAEAALRAAVAGGRQPHQLVRGLLGLVHLGLAAEMTGVGSLAADLARLRDADPQSADLVAATAALGQGQPQEALVLARQHPDSLHAVQLAGQALADAGRPGEAVELLDRAGRERRDEGLRQTALHLAVESGQDDLARRLAQDLAAAAGVGVRRTALLTLLGLAEQDGDWSQVAERCRALLEITDGLDPLTTACRWQLVAAEHHLRSPGRARQALELPDRLIPGSSGEAQLLLAVLLSSRGQVSASEDDDVRWALDVAERFPDDERVGAAALMYVLTSAAGTDTDALLARVRGLQEDFVARFPDSSLIRRVDVGEDGQGLVEHLRETLGPMAEPLGELAQRVWLGLYPQAVLADAMRRSYAELLVRRDLGCLVVAGPDAEPSSPAVARARELGAVIDLSALALLGDVGTSDRRLLAELPRVVLPAPARDDVLNARAALELRSAGTMGWDRVRARPVFTEHAPKTVDAWADRAQQLAARLRLVDVAPGAPEASHWDASLLLAQRLGLPLWADDVALRAAARSLGVPAFGTLDLISALVADGRLPASAPADAVDALLAVDAVDLPVAHRLLELAAAGGWQPVGYPALLLTRPACWQPADEGFARYRTLVRALPDPTSGVVAGWAEAAAFGLAWASPPPARGRVVGALLAWTALDGDSPVLLPLLVEAGTRVLGVTAPGADVVGPLVTALTGTLDGLAEPAEVGVLFTRLIGGLEPEQRAAAMRVFLGARRG